MNNMEIEEVVKTIIEYTQRAEQYEVIRDVDLSNGSGIKYIIKRILKKMMYWFMRPYWDQQIEYNKAIRGAIQNVTRLQCEIIGYEKILEELKKKKDELDIIKYQKGNRIIQIVSSLNYGDAVGNDVIAIQNALKEAGYVTAIFTNYIHPKLPINIAFLVEDLPELDDTDIILYHFASEDPLYNLIKKTASKVVLRYHNVTPPHFFHGYDLAAEHNTKKGLQQIKELASYIDYGIVDSEFNKADLVNMGYKCPIYVSPILIQFEDYEKEPSKSVIRRYSDGRTNIIFVGRIVPNKKIEDVISVFSHYKKSYDNSARLFLVGNYNEDDKYFNYLKKFINKCQVEDVIFSGHIPFDEILAYYSIANAFVCMSEHEGFCVPLVEAMFFNVPIVAFDSCAVPNTLGGSGVLVAEKDNNVIAELIFKLVKDNDYKKLIIEKQKERLAFFDNKRISEELLGYIKNISMQE